MAVTILIPTPLRRFIGGDASVDVIADTVGDALLALGERSPELRRTLFDEHGSLRGFVSVFLGDENVRGLGPAGQPVPVHDGDVLTLLLAIAGGAATPEELSADELRRYSRQLVLPEVGLEGQRRLKQARVLCVGAGGLGSPLALYLAAAGIGTLAIVDFDVVDPSNLQRQILYSTEDVGRRKSDAAAERLRQLNPGIEIVSHSVRLANSNALDLFSRYDIVADATDNYPARYLINDACVLARKPNVHGSILHFEGQVSVYGTTDGPCYRCLFPEPPPAEVAPSSAEIGVLGVLPGIIGSLQALEVLKLILGIGQPLVGRLLSFDALALKFHELPVHRSPGCPVCGDHPTIVGLADDRLGAAPMRE